MNEHEHRDSSDSVPEVVGEGQDSSGPVRSPYQSERDRSVEGLVLEALAAARKHIGDASDASLGQLAIQILRAVEDEELTELVPEAIFTINTICPNRHQRRVMARRKGIK